MCKKLISLLLAAALTVSLLCFPVSAAGGLDNFKRGGGYQAGQYSDVPEGSTFAANVQAGYEFGIMKGSGGGRFGVADNITRLASVIVACRLHAIYHTGGTAAMDEAYPGGAGERALAYARDNGILCAFDNVNAPATRQEFAAILSSALPDAALPAINTVEDGAIPDVPETDPYAAAIYRLYRAGVVTGSGGGVYSPASNITRGAACAIATRMCDPSLRKTITLTKAPAELNSEQVYARCSPAVFYIELYDAGGEAFASGSGFFLDAGGTAVTNYHVIRNAASAKIMTADGKTYSVQGVYDSSAAQDWAVLRIDGRDFPFLKAGAQSTVVGGAPVYAIGSPLGLQNTITQGIISSPDRVEDGAHYIQTSAAISSGSSGGALINKYGDVIGITAGSYMDGQNLNLAVPISAVTGYSRGRIVPLSELFPAGGGSSAVPAPSRRAGAFNALKAFIFNNYTTTDYGYYEYIYESSESSGTHSIYSMYYDEEYDNVVLSLRHLYKGSEAASYLYLSPSEEPCVYVLYYYLSSAQKTPTFRGVGSVAAGALTEYATLRFSKTEGDARGLDSFVELIRAMSISEVQWANAVLWVYTENSGRYSMADLGFTSI